MGLIQAGGGAIEVAAGVATSEFGVGVPLVLHGVDNIQAGLRTWDTGASTPTFTNLGIQALGASPEEAAWIEFFGTAAYGTAASRVSRLNQTAAPVGTSPYSRLDWSRVNHAGEPADVHVLRHGVDDLSRKIHGVFNENPIAVTDDAWIIVQRDGIAPVVQGSGGNTRLVYHVPMSRAGWQGGSLGSGARLDQVRIVTTPDGRVVTAFPE